MTAVAAISVAIACGQEKPESTSTARVCVDESSKVVEAELCNRPAGMGYVPYFWYYHAAYAGMAYPARGAVVRSGGRFTTTVGAPVARGGFGATARGRSVTS